MTAFAIQATANRVAGIDLTAVLANTPTASDSFPGGGDIYLRVKTGGTNTYLASVTWPTALDPYGVAKKDFPLNGGVAIPISSDRLLGPFPAAEFTDPSDGLVHLSSASTFTGTTVGVYRITNG